MYRNSQRRKGTEGARGARKHRGVIGSCDSVRFGSCGARRVDGCTTVQQLYAIKQSVAWQRDSVGRRGVTHKPAPLRMQMRHDSVASGLVDLVVYVSCAFCVCDVQSVHYTLQDLASRVRGTSRSVALGVTLSSFLSLFLFLRFLLAYLTPTRRDALLP